MIKNIFNKLKEKVGIKLGIGILSATLLTFSLISVVDASIFLSGQVGSNPVNGYVLSTNGATSTWIATGTFSQWTTTSTGIYYNGGNVGIGLSNPAYALDMAAGDAYGYNGTVMAQASTTLFNYFLGDAGTIGAAAPGTRNTGTGYQALSHLTTGNNNTANGVYSLFYNTTGGYNTANGYYSLSSNTTGGNNTANGVYSLFNNTTGGNNTANGYYSLYANTTNIATLGAITGGSGYTPGTYTGVQMTLSSGSSATTYPIATIIASSTGAITSVVITTNGLGFKDTTTFLTAPTSSLGGTGSGFKVAVASLSTGQYNTAYGYQAGRFISGGVGLNETSTYSTYIGYNAYPLASGDTNETVIGNGAVGSGSNTVTLGGTGTTGTIIPYGNVGIGTTGPATALDVAGDITDENVTSSPFLATNASGKIIFESSSTAATNLGLGTAAYTASSAYLAVGGTAANSTQLNGQAASYYQTALGFTPAHSGANSDITSLSGLTTPLSAAQGGTATTTALGTNAFNSTAYLPLTGGTLSGNVMGTTLQMLQAGTSSGNNVGSFFEPSLADGGYVNSLLFGASTAAGKGGFIQYVLGTTSTYSGSYVDIGNQGDGNGLVILKGGNVGIGTTAPATALDVNGDITDEKASGYTGRIVCYTSTGKLGNMTQAALLAGAGSATCNAN